MTGRLEAEVSSWVGVVTPNITLDNQSITLLVNVTDVNGTLKYRVQDKLVIDVNSTDNSGRAQQFILPRTVFYSIFVSRSLADAGIMPFRGLINRLLPSYVLLKSANVVNSMMGDKNDNITIPMNYAISGDQFNNSENFTMTMFVMGFMPGEVNGLAAGMPIIAQKKITLTVDYDYLVPLP